MHDVMQIKYDCSIDLLFLYSASLSSVWFGISEMIALTLLAF